MRLVRVFGCIFTACAIVGALGMAQEYGQNSPAPSSRIAVPRLIRVRGEVRKASRESLANNIEITFTLYKDENSQDAVWQEIQTVQLDSAGRFSALLGATVDGGVPLEIFSVGEARWLGIRPDGQAEQPRILFLSVPYALKAADSEMLGGKPASAFALAGNQFPLTQPTSGIETDSASPLHGSQTLNWNPGESPLTACTSVTSDGTASANQVAKFTTACNIENSAIFESGGNVGIGNTSPAGTLDVSGTAFVRGSLSALGGAVMPPTGTATATQAFISNPLELEASLYNTTLGRAANYIWQWQAEPVGNDSSATSSTLNLLYGVTGDITETGISINNNGIISFATGQTFPGTGVGTVTSVGTGAGLTGGPITKSGTISIPAAGVTNSMLANSSVTVQAGSGLSGGGTVALGGTITLASNLSGTTDGIAYFSGPTSLISTPALTNGQILIGSAGTAPALSTLTAGQNITITNNPGSITISAQGGGATTLPFFATGSARTGGTQFAIKNVTKLWGFLLPYNVTTSKITYDVTTADNSANNYDLGLFDNSGNLVADIGPTPGTTFAPSKAFQTLAWAQGSTSLSPGRYYLAFTTNCPSTCAKLGAAANNVSFAIDASVGASQGGALPVTMTPPADAWGTGNQLTIVIQ